MQKKTVAVIFGGASSEYEVSLRSAAFVISGIEREKYDLALVGITKDGRWFYYTGPEEYIASDSWNQAEYATPAIIGPDASKKGVLVFENSHTRLIPVDVVFPVLHGKNGEDGTIQGLLDMAGIPYVGAGVLASAMCMDKEITHTILDMAGIPNAGWAAVMAWEMDDFDRIETELVDRFSYPMFVKPANAGSSVGVSKAVDKASLKKGIELALVHDKKVIIEECIVGREVECAVMGNRNVKASMLGEIKPTAEFYDYNAKYQDDSTEYYIPARLSEEMTLLVREIAMAAYESLCCEGLARVDFFIRGEDEIILNEINTMPGFTSISMYPRLFLSGGMSAYDLVGGLIELAFDK